MSEILVQLALGNLTVSAMLAGAAYVVHRHGRYPGLAHLLWVSVLLKLVTPPLVLVPLLPSPSMRISSVPSVDGGATAILSGTPGAGAWLMQHGLTLLLVAWAAGSLIVLAASLVRIYRFDRMLRRSTAPAPAAVQATADDIGARYGLRRVPAVATTAASISPMTWWTGRRVFVVIPSRLVEQLSATQLRWVVAHELAHVKRRDHVVRWLEWLACVSFWWNPVAWWARRNLHQDEEASCDAFVLEHLDRRPRSYAGALLAVVELLARPSLRPPAVATGVDGGSLERRFALIVSPGRVRRAPRSMAVAILSLAVVALPLGIGAAHETEEGTSELAEATAAAPVAAAVDTVESGYRPVSASVRAGGVIRAERTLRVVQRKLLQVDRALKQDAAPKKLQRKLQEARQALRQAERDVDGAADAPTSMKRELREARQTLRQAARALRRALADGQGG